MPLVLDSVIGSKLDEFGIYFRYEKWNKNDYSSYLKFMGDVAEKSGLQADDVEYRLFRRDER